MLFFDDEIRNQRDMNKIGVLMKLLDEDTGFTKTDLDEGLRQFAARAAKE